MAKKGITAVVAVVLLLMMTVAAAGLAYMWIMNTQKDVQANTNTQLTGQQNQMQAALSIDTVWNATGSTMNVSLRNSGQYAFPLASVQKFQLYVDGALVGGGDTATYGFQSTSTFAPGQTRTINTTKSWPAPGAPKTIKIVSDIGTEASYRCAPANTDQNYC